MNKKNLVVIRDNNKKPCPFGLPIPFSCNNIGNLIEKMQPIVTEDNIKENLQILNNNTDNQACIYNKLTIKDKSLCCAPGNDVIHMPIGSPLYYKPMSGTLMTGLMTFPLGYYNDNSLDRNTYNSFYSIENISSKILDSIKKFSTVIEFRESIIKLNLLKSKNNQ